MQSLNARIVTGLFLVALVPLLFFYIVHRVVRESQLVALERKEMAAHGEHAARLLAHAGEQLLTTVEDYATWDETYEQVDVRDPKWFETYLTGWLPSQFGFHLVILVDRQGHVVAACGEPEDETPGRWPEIRNALAGRRISGLRELRGRLYLLGAAPVLHSDRRGPVNGALVCGLLVDDAFVTELSSRAPDRFVIFHGARIYGHPEAAARLAGVKIDSPKTVLVHPEPRVALQIVPLKDTTGRYVAALGALRSREYILQALHTTRRNTALAAVFACALVVGLALSLRSAILRPVTAIRQQINAMVEKRALQPLSGTPPRELSELHRAFNYMVDAIAEKEAALKRLAATDEQTGLFNHRAFVEELEALGSAGRPFSILMCDLDNLKLLNDYRGHLAGDRVLKITADIVRRVVGEAGTVYRYGGDEIAVLLPGAEARSAAEFAERIRREVADHTLPEDLDPLLPVTVSIGIAAFPEDGENTVQLVANADRALAAAKQRGRNQVVMYHPNLEPLTAHVAGERTSLLLHTVRALAAVVDMRDEYTGSHSEQVGELAFLLGQAAGLPPRQCFYLRIAGLLHDCGKIGIPDAVLQKQGRLTPEEWALMQQHPVVGGKIVQHLRTLEIIRPWIVHHHERYDGTGYPDGLQGENIPLEARILAIADAYHAMISDRPYRPALSREEALAELQRQKGRQFDPVLVDIFVTRVLPQGDAQPAR